MIIHVLNNLKLPQKSTEEIEWRKKQDQSKKEQQERTDKLVQSFKKQEEIRMQIELKFQRLAEQARLSKLAKKSSPVLTENEIRLFQQRAIEYGKLLQ